LCEERPEGVTCLHCVYMHIQATDPEAPEECTLVGKCEMTTCGIVKMLDDFPFSFARMCPHYRSVSEGRP